MVMIKRAFLVLLSAILLFSLMSCDNGAADHGTFPESVSETDSSDNTTPVTDLEYKENDDGITLTKYIGKSVDIVIPETIDGKPVTEIGTRFAASTGLGIENVWIPDTVHTIGDAAFDFCYKLKSVRLPSGLIEIKPFAFRGCKRLKSIELPESLTSIGVSAFQEAALKEITIPKNVVNIGYRAFYFCQLEKLSFAADSRLEIIDNSAFRGVNITELTLPSSVRVLDASAFSEYYLLTKVTLNDGLQKIEHRVFSFSSMLRELVIPASVTEMNYYSLDSSFYSLYFEGDLPDDFFMYAIIEEGVPHATVYLHEGAKGFNIEGADKCIIKTW